MHIFTVVFGEKLVTVVSSYIRPINKEHVNIMHRTFGNLPKIKHFLYFFHVIDKDTLRL